MSRTPLLPSQAIGVYYPESTDPVQAIAGLDMLGVTYAVIFHNDENDLKGKKPHYHYALTYPPTIAKVPTVKRFCTVTGIPENQIRVPSLKIHHSVQYLTHESKDAVKENKVLYPRENIITNNKSWYDECMEMTDDEDMTAQVLNTDIQLLADHKMKISTFLKSHPEYYYKASSLKALIDLFNNYN